PIGEERIAVSLAGGKRVIVGQEVAEFGGRVETTYRIAPDGVTLEVRSPFSQLQLTGKVTGGKLVATGTGQAGKPLSLSEPVPAGAFLSGPGIGGTVALSADLRRM